ncbi:uncharacterized protein LOC127833902 [Dreissena polymorpha]|uniref:uncharacterized protein LOC127833902 n=1 Tax=Dreissena polymorpha TaxID=45954 RepID=UPI0022641C7A|nr:uncharacterized protein LOC127833902 [Dreissena polymorpha]
MQESKENIHYGYKSESEDDPLYSIVNKKQTMHLIRTHVIPGYLTVRKKYINAETTTFAVDCDSNTVDPLYSVVEKKKIRGIVTDDWNQAVPPAPACSSSVDPPYSKVNKKNKKGNNTSDER